MDRCPSGKRIYATETMAEEALLDAWTRFDFDANRGPVAVYQCEECGQFHFTSRPPMNTRLAEALREGKIQRRAEANRWENKWRRH